MVGVMDIKLRLEQLQKDAIKLSMEQENEHMIGNID
jgi:hypothetical protein